MAKLLRLLEQDCTLTHEQLASMTDMTCLLYTSDAADEL